MRGSGSASEYQAYFVVDVQVFEEALLFTRGDFDHVCGDKGRCNEEDGGPY